MIYRVLGFIPEEIFAFLGNIVAIFGREYGLSLI